MGLGVATFSVILGRPLGSSAHGEVGNSDGPWFTGPGRVRGDGACCPHSSWHALLAQLMCPAATVAAIIGPRVAAPSQGKGWLVGSWGAGLARCWEGGSEQRLSDHAVL